MDRFASMNTTQCTRYNNNSLFLDLLTSGKENSFVNSPLRLMDKAICVIFAQRAFAKIITPMWKAKNLCQNLKALSIVPPICLPKAKLFLYSTQHSSARGIKESEMGMVRFENLWTEEFQYPQFCVIADRRRGLGLSSPLDVFVRLMQ